MSSAVSPAQIEPIDRTWPAPSRRSWLGGLAYRTLGRAGAQAGVVWLMIVGFAAVFAPFLANSHPLLMRMSDGSLTSPLFKHLTATDVALPILTLGAVLLFFPRRWPGWLRFSAYGALTLVTVSVCWAVIDPPKVVVYDRYRTMQVGGQVLWSLHVPVPYSASDRMRDMPERKLQPPGNEHWLGTTINNSDLLSRMIHACRIAMAVGFIATGIAVVLGVIIGGLMGYFSRWVDLLGMRLVEIFEAIPSLYLLLTFVAFFPRNLYLMMAIIGLVSWTGYARFTRAEFLKLRQQDYVLAARALGLPLWSILFRHLLPNGIAPVLVTASFGIASAILAESFLSFIGLGLIDEPSWGQLLSQAVGSSGGFVWWIAVFPGLAIFLTVFAYNLLGEALRDALDPKAN
jgi:peptide/nickel transport system permease protein